MQQRRRVAAELQAQETFGDQQNGRRVLQFGDVHALRSRSILGLGLQSAISRRTAAGATANFCTKFKAGGRCSPQRRAERAGLSAGADRQASRRAPGDGAGAIGRGREPGLRGPKRDYRRMLLARALAGFVFLFAVLAIVLFGSAGTLQYGRAWLTLAVFFGCAGAITVWLWLHDKALLERRVKAGPGAEPDRDCRMSFRDWRDSSSWRPSPRRVRSALRLVARAFRRFARWRRDDRHRLRRRLPHLPRKHVHRLEPSRSPRANKSSPAAPIDRAPPDVRGRAGYGCGNTAGAGLVARADPPALLVPVLVWRLTREEAFLATHLAGYSAYRDRVGYRLLPMLW